MELGELKTHLNGLVAKPGVKFDDCEDFLRYAFKLAGIEFAENIYEAKGDFILVHSKGSDFDEYNAKFMDIAVFRNYEENSRHVGIMLDKRWMVHYASQVRSVARAEITRDQWCLTLLHIGRHRKFCADNS